MEIVQTFDNSVLNFLNSIQNGFFDWLFKISTYLGDNGYLWFGIAFILLCFKKTRGLGVTIILSMGLSFLCSNVIIKNLVRRARPFIKNKEIQLIINAPYGYSFPSAHSSSSFAAATSIFAKNKKSGMAAYFVASMITLSRSYLHVHYPTDIICGAVIGVLCGVFGTSIFKKLEKLYLNDKENKVGNT
ncbi:MAG: phosphatase PAP2 family protein [Clostridiales bacterium]|nr:phosphatase PAP2 family protein [Clostridiales bacterium]